MLICAVIANKSTDFQVTFSPVLAVMDELWPTESGANVLTNEEQNSIEVFTNGNVTALHARRQSEMTPEVMENAGGSPTNTLPETPGRSMTPANLSSRHSREVLRGNKELARRNSRLTLDTNGESEATPRQSLSGQVIVKQQSSANSLQARMGGVTRRLSQLAIGKKGSKISVKNPTMERFNEG